MGHLLYRLELELPQLQSQIIGKRYQASLPQQLVVLPAQAPAVVDIAYQSLSLLDYIVEKHLRLPVSELIDALLYGTFYETDAEKLVDLFVFKLV